MFCCMLLNVHSSFAIILIGKRDLVALLGLSFWCPVMVVWLFLTVSWVCLQFVILVFPDHTRVLLLIVGIAFIFLIHVDESHSVNIDRARGAVKKKGRMPITCICTTNT